MVLQGQDQGAYLRVPKHGEVVVDVFHFNTAFALSRQSRSVIVCTTHNQVVATDLLNLEKKNKIYEWPVVAFYSYDKMFP